MDWQGLAGATQALTCTAALSCVSNKLTVAYPLELVCALAALSVAAPWFTVKFTFTLLRGVPSLRARAVTGMLTVAPCATQRMGLRTPMSEDVSVELRVALTDRAGE